MNNFREINTQSWLPVRENVYDNKLSQQATGPTFYVYRLSIRR